VKIIGTQPRSDGAGVVKLEDDSGTGATLEAWTPDLETVKSWGEGPIPEDWELKDGKRGKLLVKKRGGGGGGYRQSKEAFDREAESRARWQEFESESIRQHQEREWDWRHRDSALKAAVEGIAASGRGLDEPSWTSHGAPLANAMYEWLRSSPAAGPTPTSADGAATSERNAPAPRAGASKPEEERGGPGPAGRPEPPSSGFPISPEKCNHKTSAGRWVKWVEANVHDFSTPGDVTIKRQLVCPKCGTPKLVAMEGTTADLGPA